MAPQVLMYPVCLLTLGILSVSQQPHFNFSHHRRS